MNLRGYLVGLFITQSLIGCLPENPHLPAEPIGEYPSWGHERQNPKALNLGSTTPGSGKKAAADNSLKKRTIPQDKTTDEHKQQLNKDGQNIFEARCALCHGKDGQGLAHMQPIPNLTDPVFHKNRPDEKLREHILNGKGRMPGFKNSLSAEQVNHVIDYIRSFTR